MNLTGVPVVFSAYHGKGNPPVLIEGVIYAYDEETLKDWLKQIPVDFTKAVCSEGIGL